MKTLKLILSTILLAYLSAANNLFGEPREIVCNAIPGDVGLHKDGMVPLKCITAAITQRYLLVQKGTNDDEMIVNVATTRPWGVITDEAAIDDYANVAILGAIRGTVRMVANAAITVGTPVYTAAAGKVSPTFGATLYMVGRALTAAAADGDYIEVVPCFPLLNSATL